MTAAVVKAKLHRGQQMVYVDNSRFKVVVAGRRWGKSMLAKTICIHKAAGKKRAKVWYVAPSYTMAKNIMWDELKMSVPRDWVVKTNETDMSITLKNGSKIECKGADSPDSLRGTGLFYVVLDEFQDMKPDVWDLVLRPTLARDKGHALFIGTPKGYANLYDVYKIGKSRNRLWQSWQFPTITSPFIPKSELEDAARDMDPVAFRQEFMASFETMSGRVYHGFDRNLHVQTCEFNPNLPIWVGQDFNIDPMSTVVLQPQPSGEVWVVDEIFQRNSNTLAICEELERRYWRFMGKSNPQIIIYPDPAGGNRQHARGESDLDIFREKDFRAQKYRRKHPAVADRINAVNKMFMSASGEIKIRVDTGCTELISSLEQTLYKAGTRDVDKKAGMEHMADALGYPIELEFPSRKVQVLGVSI